MERRELLFFLIASAVLFQICSGDQKEQKSDDPDGKLHFTSNQSNGQDTKKTRQAPIHDSKHIHDKEHIKEHLQEVTNVKDDDLSEGNMQFHYFKLHDYDNNDKLDGIELANAMTHYHDEETGEKAEDYTEDELGSMVDTILEEDDTNHDGYIDYPEFIASQNRE